MSEPKPKSPLEEFFNELTFKATVTLMLGIISICMWSFSSSHARISGDFHDLTEALLKVIRSQDVTPSFERTWTKPSESSAEARLIRLMTERNASLKKIEQALLALPVDQPIVLMVPEQQMPDRPGPGQ